MEKWRALGYGGVYINCGHKKHAPIAKEEFEAKNKDRIEAYKEYKEAVSAG